MDAYHSGESQADAYEKLVAAHPCSPEDQAGEDAKVCPACDRRTVHQYAHVCMACGEGSPEIPTTVAEVEAAELVWKGDVRAGVVEEITQGRRHFLSCVTGVPEAVLQTFADTGAIGTQHFYMLEATALETPGITEMGVEAIRRLADHLGGPKFEGTPTPGLVVTLCDREEPDDA